MARLKDQIEAMRRELSVGRGGRLWPYSVSLEPPFLPFSYLTPNKGLPKGVAARPASEPPQGKLRLLTLRPSGSDQYSLGLAEQFLVSLNPTQPLAFEALGTAGQVRLQVAAAPQDAGTVAAQVEAHYPGCALIEDIDVLGNLRNKIGKARGYRLQRSHLFPLRDSSHTEPYVPMIALLGSLPAGEAALFQVLFVPVCHDWKGNLLSLARDPFDPGKPAPVGVPRIQKKAETKAAKALFAVAIRLAACNEKVIRRLEGAFLSQFQSEENGLEPMQEPYPIDGVIGRVTYSRGMLLNAGELSALVHLPAPDTVPKNLARAEPGAPPPHVSTQHILAPLGVNLYRGVTTPVGISEDWLTRHLAILGGTGYGKTNLMKHALGPMLEQGYGMAVLDPKGDLAQGFLDLVPEHRIRDVVWFDPTDRNFPPGLNVLQASEHLEDETLTAELMVGLGRLFRGTSEFGPRMSWLLKNAVRTLLASEGEKTLYDIPRFLEDERFRAAILATVKDRELREFWHRRNLSQTVVDPVLNRLSSFLDRPTIRDIVAQPNRIDFHRIMREGGIFLANLEKGVLQDAAYILGSFILSRLQLAALARKPGDRKPFPILVDEFHNFAGQGMDTESIETFFSEARSYKAPLVVATQYLGRLNREVAAALMANAGTMVVLHLGQADAQPLAKELGGFTPEDLLSLNVGEAVVRMGSAREAFNVKVPLMEPGDSHREAVVALSRERYCRSREEVETILRRRWDPSAPQSEPAPTGLAADEHRFLTYLVDHPEATVSAARQELGLGGSMAQRLRERLVQAGYLQIVETRLGKGGNLAKFAVPTKAGLGALGRTLPGRGGPAHRHFQQLIASQARAKGFQAQIEKQLDSGGFVDVHLERGSERIAVEVSVVPEVLRELRNVEKCLKAGYAKVFCLFLDADAVEEARAEAAKRWPQDGSRQITFAGLTGWQDAL